RPKWTGEVARVQTDRPADGGDEPGRGVGVGTLPEQLHRHRPPHVGLSGVRRDDADRDLRIEVVTVSVVRQPADVGVDGGGAVPRRVANRRAHGPRGRRAGSVGAYDEPGADLTSVVENHAGRPAGLDADLPQADPMAYGRAGLDRGIDQD